MFDALAKTASKPSLEIRPMRVLDFRSVSRLDRESFSEPLSVREVRKSLEGFSGRMGLSAVLSGVGLIGYAMFRICPDATFLDRLAVDSGYRRRGVGSALLARVVEIAGRTPFRLSRRVRVMLNEEKLDAQLFLRRFGFRAVGVERGRFGSRDGFVLEAGVSDAEGGFEIQ